MKVRNIQGVTSQLVLNSENIIICIPLVQANGKVYPNFCPIRLSMTGSWPTMVVTGNEEYGFDSGEGA